VLVANAGITKDTLLARMKEEDFTSVLDTNLTGAYRVIRRAARAMTRARFGRIVVMSSVVGLLGSPGQVNYAASKAGLIGIARSVSRELGARGVTCNVVAPGFIATDMTAVLPEKTIAEYQARIPARRLGEVDDVVQRRSLPRLRRHLLHHRRRHPGRWWPRNGSLVHRRGRRLPLHPLVSPVSACAPSLRWPLACRTTPPRARAIRLSTSSSSFY
jgi:hypothetical protein